MAIQGAIYSGGQDRYGFRKIIADLVTDVAADKAMLYDELIELSTGTTYDLVQVAGVKSWAKSAGAGIAQSLTSAIVNGATLTAAARASMLPAANRVVIPANSLRVGQSLRVRASGFMSSVITTPGTARFDLQFTSGAPVVIFDGLAVLLDTVAAHVAVGWILDVRFTVRAIGVAGNGIGSGTFSTEDLLGTPATAPKGSLHAMLPWNITPVVSPAFDTTIDNTLDLFFTQTVATGSITLQQYVLESL